MPPADPAPTTITRTYQGADACGNTADCEQIITVDDKTAPGLTCPDDITVSCTTEVPDPNTAAVATSDNCGGSVTVTHIGDAPADPAQPPSPAPTRAPMPAETPPTANRSLPSTIKPRPPRRHDRFLPEVPDDTAAVTSDNCGGDRQPHRTNHHHPHLPGARNTADCEQIITVDDKNVAPPSPFLRQLDNCGGSVTVTHIGDAPGGSCPTTITRTYQGADACGNTADCEQIITVDDKTAPGLTCPDDITVSCTTEVPRPEHRRRRHFRQLRRKRDRQPHRRCPRRILPHTTITRTYQGADACGNTADCEQIITVDDKTAPG